jgi:hypothetical protein
MVWPRSIAGAIEKARTNRADAVVPADSLVTAERAAADGERARIFKCAARSGPPWPAGSHAGRLRGLCRPFVYLGNDSR